MHRPRVGVRVVTAHIGGVAAKGKRHRSARLPRCVPASGTAAPRMHTGYSVAASIADGNTY